MKVLILGVTGAIGQLVERFLKSKKIDVLGASRQLWLRHDVKNGVDESFLSGVGAVDVVVNCLGLVDFYASKSELFSVNVKGVYESYILACKLNAKAYVNISSAALLGETVYTPIDDWHPEKPTTNYHRSKYFGEKALERLGCAHQVPWFSLRIPAPIVLNRHHNSFLSNVFRCLVSNEELTLTGCFSWRQSYLDVRDIGDFVMLNNLTYESSGNYIFAPSLSHSHNDIIYYFEDHFKRKLKVNDKRSFDQNFKKNLDFRYSSIKLQENFNFSCRDNFASGLRWLT